MTEGNGGGVYVGENAEFTMEGGTITGNTATSDSDGYGGYSGGVYVYDDKATFTMEGGTISENNASKYGGGVFVDNGATFNLSGSPTITGNTVGDDDNNVYLLEGIMINIAGTLTEAASVGVTMEEPGVFTTGLSGNGSDKNFSSDDTTYAVGLTDEREAFLGYTVTIADDIQNGTVSADKTVALLEDTVTLTVTPATGYKYTLTVFKTGDENTKVDVSNNTFKMPAYPVTVSATFTLEDYTVTVTSGIEHGTVSADKTEKVHMGDTVTLTVTPATGYKLATLTVKQGETAVTVTNNSFTMPAGNVTVSATFTLEDYTVTVTSGIEHGTVSADRTENVHMGDTITLTVIPDKGYRLATLTVKQGDTIIDVKDNSFTMPSGNVTVNAEFVRVYTVTFDSDGGSAVASQTVDAGKNASKPAPDPTKNKAIFQNWYKVTGGNMAEAPFDFGTAINEDTTLKAKWKYATVLKTGGEGTSENGSIGIISGLEKDNTTGGYYGTPGGEVELELKPNEGCVLTGLEINGEDVLNGVDENGHYTFDMPEEDVTINAKFEKAAALSVQLTANPAEGVKVGDTITFTATVTNTGNVSVTGGALESALTDLSGKTFALAPGESATFTYTYTVTQAIFDSEEVVDTVKANATAAVGSNPDEASATATVSSKKLYTITTDSAITGGSVTPSLTGATGIPATKATEGDTVHLRKQANSGYEFSRYVVTNANGGAVTLDEGDESFTMPAGNVTVSAKFRKVPGVSVTGAENLTYNGKAQALIASAGTDAGKLEYAVTDAQTQPKGGWDDKIPTRTDAGTYIVWYRVQGNDDIVGYPSALRAAAFERNPLPHRHDTSFDSTDRL